MTNPARKGRTTFRFAIGTGGTHHHQPGNGRMSKKHVAKKNQGYSTSAMKTKPPFAAVPETDPASVTQHSSPARKQVTMDQPGPHVNETAETIESRATSVTVVLQKIMMQQTNYPYPHGGIND
jgi:hypothetical protein